MPKHDTLIKYGLLYNELLTIGIKTAKTVEIPIVILKKKEVTEMLMVASRAIEKKQRIYHRCGCMYAQRIKPEHRKELDSKKVLMLHYRECKYCGGLAGDVRAHRKTIDTWTQKNNMIFTYHGKTQTLYMRTEIGCWKIFRKEELGQYLLYHRNFYDKGMRFKEAANGEYHRQRDVKATASLDKLVEYIIAHDRAKLTIMDDYRKLPRSTKQQEKYYNAAKKRNERRRAERLDNLFFMIECKEGIRKLSYC